MFTVHDGKVWMMVKSKGARPRTEIEEGFISGFPRMQSGMFVILCNTIFITVILTCTCIYSHVVSTSKYF